MRKIKIQCDHCGKSIDPKIDFDEVDIEVGYHCVRADLCVDCLEMLWKTISDFMKRDGD